jgi:signal transduction histidine kinase
MGWADMREAGRREMMAHRVVACVMASAALYACALTFSGMHEKAAMKPAAVAIATVIYVAFAVIPILRWAPLLPVVVSTLGALATMAAGAPDTLCGPALVVAVFVYSVNSERTPLLTTKAAIIVLLLTFHGIFMPEQGWTDLDAVPWILLAGAIGQAVRAKRAEMAALQERARRAEEGRDGEARRRVQEERLRIARELHDAVGHQVALINVQAGAMGYLLDSDPEQARESLGHIQKASAAALEELRLTVGLLRQDGDVEPVEPPGGLGRLDELISSFASTGLSVTCDVTGAVRPLPEAVDRTAYRVIQESLTNTTKHAAGARAWVRLAFGPGMLSVAVEDDGVAVPVVVSSGSGEGHGIIGMRERAAALGGWLMAGPRPDGGFRIMAELPT